MELITIIGFGIAILVTLTLILLVVWNLKIVDKIHRRRTTSYREIIKFIKIAKHRKR
jgi:hypothetical protein